MSFIIKDLSRGLVLIFIYNMLNKGNLVRGELFYALYRYLSILVILASSSKRNYYVLVSLIQGFTIQKF